MIYEGWTELQHTESITQPHNFICRISSIFKSNPAVQASSLKAQEEEIWITDLGIIVSESFMLCFLLLCC